MSYCAKFGVAPDGCRVGNRHLLVQLSKHDNIGPQFIHSTLMSALGSAIARVNPPLASPLGRQSCRHVHRGAALAQQAHSPAHAVRRDSNIHERVFSTSDGSQHEVWEDETFARRTVLTALALLPATALSARPGRADEDSTSTEIADDTLTTVTDRVYLEFGLCPEGVRTDRRLGDKSILCSDPAPIGRVVIGLYGNAAPGTVANFKTLASSGALNGTALSKVLPGQWISAGQQGPHRSGLLEAPPEIGPNPDLLSAKAFRLRHLRPGTVSLNLSENEDDEVIRGRRDYRNLGFLITTGPAPPAQLDGENIVFGAVVGE